MKLEPIVPQGKSFRETLPKAEAMQEQSEEKAEAHEFIRGRRSQKLYLLTRNDAIAEVFLRFFI